MKGAALCLLLALAVNAAVVSAVTCPAGNLGPTPTSGGYCFGVWAPHAQSASVQPQNGASWSPTKMALNSSSGVFSAFVAGVQPGDAYVFEFNGNLQRLDPRAQAISPGTDFTYSVVHDPSFEWSDAALSFTPPGAEKAVVYEMHIPTFNQVNGQAGTFASAAQRLPYLARLGITMIELMPIGTFCDQADGWGYNPCAPYAAMQAFGGYKGLKSFVDRANSLGIGVMLDIVWNHADPGNILKQFDGYSGAAGNGIYFYETQPNAETLWGPRWNYPSQGVTEYIIDSVRMWLEEYHISGFRWDSTVCIRKPAQTCWTESGNINDGWKLMQAANSLTLELEPKAVTAAEDSQDYASITDPVDDHSAGWPAAPGGAGFVSQWGYKGFFYAFFTQLTMEDNSNVDMGQVAQLASSSSEGTRVLFTENHDMASNQNHGRIPNVVDPGGSASNPTVWAIKKSMLGVGVIATSPGIPMLLQGQEFLSYATFNFPSPPPLDWSLTNSNAGIVQMVSDMLALRTNANGTSAGLTTNNAQVVQTVDESNAKVAVIYRASDDGSGDVIVVINMYNSKCGSFTLQNIPRDGTWNVAFNGDDKKYSPLNGGCGTGQSVTINNGSGTLQLPEYAMLILTQ